MTGLFLQLKGFGAEGAGRKNVFKKNPYVKPKRSARRGDDFESYMVPPPSGGSFGWSVRSRSSEP